MDILVNVVGQKMNVTTVPSTLVARSQNFIRFVFRFSEDWEGLDVLAQFTQGDLQFNRQLDSVTKSTYLPQEFQTGKFTVVLFGVGGNNVRAFSNILEFNLQKNGFVGEEFMQIEPPDPTPTWYEDLMNRIRNVIDMSDEEVMAVISNAVGEIMDEYMQTDAWRQSIIAIEDNSILSSKYAPGSLIKNKMEQSVQDSLDLADTAMQPTTYATTIEKANNSMQPSMYDTHNKQEDIFDYADTKSGEAVTSAVSSIRSVQSFSLPNESNVSTSYTGLDQALSGIISTAKSYADTKVNGSTEIVTQLPLSGDENKNYILNTNGKYMMYRYIGDAWELIAGGAAEVITVNQVITYFEDDSPTNKGINPLFDAYYIDYSAMRLYYGQVEIEVDSEDETYYQETNSWVPTITFVSSPDEMTDYFLYLSNANKLYHLRYMTDKFVIVNKSESTMVVNSLPTYPKTEVDYILNDNGEYKYYKYINGAWRMIAGGGGEIITRNHTIDYFKKGTPAANNFEASAYYLEKYYLDSTTLTVYEIETETENETTTYSWVGTALVANPSTSKDYYVQFGSGTNLYHFRYINNSFVLIGSDSYSKSEVDTMVQGIVTDLGGDISDVASDVSTLTSQMNNISNMVKDVTISQDKTTLTITYMNNDTSTIELDTGIDIDTTRYNVDDDHKLHFYDSQGNELEGLAVEITGAGGGGAAISGSVTIGRITAASIQTIFGSGCTIQYTVSAVDASNEQVGDGVGTLYINNIAVATGFNVATSALGAINSIDVGNYLSVGTNTVKISVSIDTGGETNTVATKTWSVNAINMYLSWDYTDSQVNSSAVTDYYTPYGALSKTIYTFIDVEPIGFNPKIVDTLPDITDPEFDAEDVIGINYFVGNAHTHYIYDETEEDFVLGTGRLLDVNTTTRSGVQQALTIPMQTHGSHAIVRFMTGDVNGETIATSTQVHDMVFVVAGETDPIIATSFNTAQMIQYNTVQIPIVVYDPSRTTTTVILAEDGNTVSTWTGVDRTLHYWNYSPTTFGTKTLTISCGNTTKTIVIKVTQLDINEEEVIGYDFRFKASELATNTAVQQWSDSYTPVGSSSQKTVSMTFSNNFDWINGGLHTEYDEDNHLRQYLCVRAGTYVNINYDLFGKEYDPKQYGKNFKFVFKAANCRTYDAQVLSCMDTSNGNNGVGLTMTANEATFSTANNSIKTYYYKDSYIEFETNIHPDTEYPYLQFWMDGSHDVTKLYDSSDDIQQVNPVGITIGSPNCDVYIYMIKAYPTYLSNNNELSNFIMDAPNAYEMVDRYNRNDILNANGEIDYQKLATVNPDLHVLCLDLNRMSTGKKDNTVAYSVRHIYNRGGANQCFTINNACVTIQGTSSVGYLESAGNVDINFKYNRTFTSDNVSYTTGDVEFDDGTSSTSGFAMTTNSIPVDYMNVKVNVASSENANNACIADWYNTYQPWLSPVRAKKSKARDTMEFVPGVIFIRDRSGNLFYTEQQDTQTGQTVRIPDTQNYHMYGICDIGNSKKNTKVFHDTTNPIACCVEVSNNTSLPCLMSSKTYTWNADDDATIMEVDPESGELKEQKVFEFRYSNDDTVDLAKDAWDRFVSFMYDNNPNLATNEPLDSPVTFGTYTFKGYGTYDTSDYDSEDYTVIYLYGYGAPADYGYAAADYVSNTTNDATCYYYINYSNNQIYSSDGTAWTSVATLTKTLAQNNVLAGTSVGTYAGTYTTDSFNYRMACMLEHCEEYMIMDPVIYHFVFIESFLMTDNVAKNTFWSSDDLVHWELSKDYDNDKMDVIVKPLLINGENPEMDNALEV